jgi:uroporphyrinogen-III synthase
LFARLIDAAGLSRAAIAAISPATAAAAGTGWGRIAVAAVPTDDALLAAAARLCEETG